MVRHTFHHVETELTALWDFGWFDLSRFVVASPTGAVIDALLADFVTDQIFRRSFCENPDPWGRDLDRHGPFLCDTFSHEWYVPIPSVNLASDIVASIRDTELEPAPTDQQLKPIYDWIASSRRADAWKLQAPENGPLRVDWAHIWFAFQEYVAYDHDNSQLTVAVIGYD